MQRTSELFKTLLRSEHRKETKLVIAGETYSGAGEIFSCSTFGRIFEKNEIGNCAASQIDLRIRPKSQIPRQARIEAYVRIVSGEQASEWAWAGVYFFARRKTDRVTGIMTVHGYDAMLKAEEIWLDETYAEENFPMAPDRAVADIAARMGVKIDPRTHLNPAFSVHYPVDGEGDLTMREVLARLAVANAGNWIITPAGDLLLLPFNSAPPETNFLVTEHGDAIVIGGVRILV